VPTPPVITETKVKTSASGHSRQIVLDIPEGMEGMYWFDGPSEKGNSKLFTGPFVFDQAGTVYAVARTRQGAESLPTSRVFAKFYDLNDVDKNTWKVVRADSYQPGEGEMIHAIDGNPQHSGIPIILRREIGCRMKSTWIWGKCIPWSVSDIWDGRIHPTAG
jgi:hypothetical protein